MKKAKPKQAKNNRSKLDRGVAVDGEIAALRSVIKICKRRMEAARVLYAIATSTRELGERYHDFRKWERAANDLEALLDDL